MTTLVRRLPGMAGVLTVLTAFVTVVAACAGCGSPFQVIPPTPSPTPLVVSGTPAGAPYAADVDHLEEILSIGEGHRLPDGAQVASVRPAVNHARWYGYSWGYVIAFTATDQAIRDYVDEHTIFTGDNLEKYQETTRPDTQGLEDIDLSTVSRPWDTRCFGDSVLLLERPLGRGWLVITGSVR